ncbi:unnamed protein product [Protopolystoma xenopodis]|uniref:Uncharacterized protein n=1 Tax=Protopolystoma xenopodis TaxID=117903 RepID=A0A448X8P0_9PLAT|nr:unnamed protein product [Protopolystoma xenopodis]
MNLQTIQMDPVGGGPDVLAVQRQCHRVIGSHESLDDSTSHKFNRLAGSDVGPESGYQRRVSLMTSLIEEAVACEKAELATEDEDGDVAISIGREYHLDSPMPPPVAAGRAAGNISTTGILVGRGSCASKTFLSYPSHKLMKRKRYI